ncbi:hypothetical protein GCM10027566_07030 [Arachidicoccus ginsenosidivorans]|uniref:Sulfotransferase n=1 Tax=Arachidicoccus ginsenosidivorans TaxID=496057 RepID=A0A5B8VQI6_9BACT|nr:sulfotransferase [Arachidicoccus ginsenosidivorans]QEC73914.1 sulfotransferase [Arachidicoccus ginsenosidivorans]
MKTVFIIGQHRTGSTLLRNMLHAHSDVSMAFDEMNLFEPFRKNTLDRLLHKSKMSGNRVMELISAGFVYGTFWKQFLKSGISLVELKMRLNTYNKVSADIVVKSVLDILHETEGTQYVGVKYPLHISRAATLRDWFPGSKVIFITRNPKAIIASKLNDPATKIRKKKSFFHRFGIHYFTLLYFCFEFKKSVSIYFSNKNHLHLVSYEALVSRKQNVLTSICDFCGIGFEDGMMCVSGKQSSFLSQKDFSPAIETRNPDEYKRRLSRFDLWLIGVLTDKSFKKLKDEYSTNL